MRPKRTARIILVSLVFLLLGMALGSRVDQPTEDVWRVRLVARYELHYHKPPISAVGLACPGVDYMRPWPLPVIQPWDERPELDCNQQSVGLLDGKPQGWFCE